MLEAFLNAVKEGREISSHHGGVELENIMKDITAKRVPRGGGFPEITK